MTPWNKQDYIKLTFWFFPAAVLTWGIHEFAHYGMGILLGYDMWISFNQAGPVSGSYQSAIHTGLIAMSGPIITWFQALIAFKLINKLQRLHIYAFLFLTLYMRILAMGISYLSSPNDEAKVSLLLGLPMWVVPSFSVMLLFVLTYLGSKRLKVGWKGNIISYLMASLVTTIVVFSDRIMFS